MRTLTFGLALAISLFAVGAEAQPAAPDAPPAKPAAPAPATTTEEPEAAPEPAAPPPPVEQTAPPAPAPAPALMPFGVNAPPQGAPPMDTGTTEPAKPPRPKSLYPRWQALIGVRTGFINDKGLDPFSEDDVVPHLSLGGARTVYTKDELSLAAVAFWDFGMQRSTARGERTELEMHHFSLGPEARFHMMPELYFYARPSASALRTIARMDETSTGTKLYARNWDVAVDAVAGGAFEFLNLSGERGELRMFVHAEGGYGWSTASDLRLSPDEEDESAPQRVAALDLGTLALRGPMFRVMVSAAF